MINIDTKKIRKCGSDIIRLSNDLNYIIELVYNRLIDMPTKTGEWRGKSADRYANLVKKDKDQAVDLKNILYNYGKTLIDNADKYDEITNQMIL